MIVMSVRMDTDEHHINGPFACVFSVIACFLLSVIYVASLYVWNSQHDRNHPSTIKRRFLSVFIMSLISPLFLYFCTPEYVFRKVTLLELLGIRTKGIFTAIVIPLFLTMILFLGPLSMQSISGKWKLYFDPVHWKNNFQNLIWLRNHIVAPLSEEFTFRACMVPLLLPCFQPTMAIIIGQLFFGIAHFHHMIEKIKTGINFKTALLISCFQFTYTTLFGAYSAYLLLKTGHLMSSFVVHAFCNHLGFPDVTELSSYESRRKIITIFLFVAGLVIWCFLITPLTNETLYNNDVYIKLTN